MCACGNAGDAASAAAKRACRAGRQGARRRGRRGRLSRAGRRPPPLPPPSRTIWTRLVPPSILIGHGWMGGAPAHLRDAPPAAPRGRRCRRPLPPALRLSARGRLQRREPGSLSGRFGSTVGQDPPRCILSKCVQRVESAGNRTSGPAARQLQHAMYTSSAQRGSRVLQTASVLPPIRLGRDTRQNRDSPGGSLGTHRSSLIGACRFGILQQRPCPHGASSTARNYTSSVPCAPAARTPASRPAALRPATTRATSCSSPGCHKLCVRELLVGVRVQVFWSRNLWSEFPEVPLF